MRTLVLKLSMLLFLVVNVVPKTVFAELKLGFYNTTCPKAEAIVQEVVAQHFAKDPFIAPGLLRLHFHDCFVKGCDASLLIDSTPEERSEKATGPNFTVRGYEVIDAAKEALEKACPGTVSCADIISLATRDAVAISGGPKIEMPTGRRDGLASSPQDVNLPGPRSTVADAFTVFEERGFSKDDMVILLGAHTVGVAHCMFFDERITGARDPSLDPNTAMVLRDACESHSSSPADKPTAFLDQNTSMVFDNDYFIQLVRRKGVLQIDQNLERDPSTNAMVIALANDPDFFARKFSEVFVRLCATEVLVGDQGEIRKNCRVFNDPVAAERATDAQEKAEAAAQRGGAAQPSTAPSPEPQPTTRRLRQHLGVS